METAKEVRGAMQETRETSQSVQMSGTSGRSAESGGKVMEGGNTVKAMTTKWEEVSRMRNYLVAMLVVIISMVILAPVQVRADQTVTVGNYTYTLSGKVATIASYNGTASSVTLPTSVTYDGTTYSVTSVGASAFAGNQYLKTVVIPKGITSLGNCAFKDCVNLSSVTINDNIADCNSYSSKSTSYSNYYNYTNYAVFYNAGANADKLEVTFGDGVTSVGGYLFATGAEITDTNYAHVTSVTFSDSVKTIGAYAFYHCYDLKEITWSSKLLVIGDGTFAGNNNFTTLTIPNTVTTIGAQAFSDWTSLKTLVIPKSVTSVGYGAFRNAVKLNSVTINGNISDCDSYASKSTSYSNYYNYMNYAVFYNAGTDADKLEVVFGNGVTSVGGYLFATGAATTDTDYAHVTSVTFSDSVKTIGAYAFYHCYDLKEITWSSKLQVIGDGAFAGNDNFTTFTVPSTVTTIGAQAFSDWTSLKTLVIPKSVTSVGYGAFRNAVNLSTVTINGNISDCDNYAIKSTSYSNYYNYTNYAVFYNAGTDADKLEVTFGDGVTSVGGYLFATAANTTETDYAHVTSVTFSDSVKTIGAYAFYHCYDLKKITWSSKLQVIGDGAFAGNDNFTTFTVPSTVTTIGAQAFSDWTSLKTLVIPKSVTSVGYGAFRNAVKLSSVTINGNVSDCDNYAVKSTSYSNYYNYTNYAVFYNAGTDADELAVTFGSGVTCIPAYLFATAASNSDNDYAHITSVTLSDSVVTIAKYAFYNCYDLESVTLSSALTTIGDYAFANAGFDTIRFTSNVSSISNTSFSGVTATAEYPYPSLVWTSSMRQNYGGTLTWKKYNVTVALSDTTATLGTTSYTYDGKAKKPSVTVTYGDMTLTKDTDYTVSYSNNTNVGTAKVTITGKGNFTGTKTLTFTIGLKAPTISSITQSGSDVTIKWGKIAGASGYYIYRSTSKSSGYSKIATVSSGSTVSYKDTASKTNGTTYYYKVYAYSGSTKSSGSGVKSLKYMKAAVSSLTNTSSGITVKWSKVSGANGYYIYRKTGSGSYTKVKTITSASTTSWTDTAVKSKNGTTYTYYVKPYNSSSTGTCVTKTTVRLTAVSISSLKNSSSKKMTVKWAKNSKATGYEIQYSTSSSFSSGTKTVTVSGASNVSKVISSLTKGKTYYVRIRAYKSVSGTKYYSAWSDKKSVKISK